MGHHLKCNEAVNYLKLWLFSFSNTSNDILSSIVIIKICIYCFICIKPAFTIEDKYKKSMYGFDFKIIKYKYVKDHVLS